MRVYIDGRYYEKDDAKISVFDHGLLYGDGVFEGIRIYGGRLFRLEEHIARLYRSAKAIALSIPLAPGELADAVREAVARNEKRDGYVRLVVTRGVGCLGVDPSTCARPTVIIIVDDIALYPRECYERGIAVITVSTRRLPVDALDPRIKSLNYLNNILAKLQARQAGCLEAVMLDGEGFVAECTGDNLFIARDRVLLTPAPYRGALDGITKRSIQELARAEGIETAEATLSCYDLYTADECFLTGTGAEIMPVVAVDGRQIGDGAPGPVTRSLARAFERLVRAGAE